MIIKSMNPSVVAVHASTAHAFSKCRMPRIELLAGHGVVGDAHFGTTVKHRSRVAKDASQPNLRQVHLLHSELFAELSDQGLCVSPGQTGENITTIGIPLLSLAEGTVLRIGPQATVRITGLRNPCAQIESFMPGLLAAVATRNSMGAVMRKAGVMGVVLESGFVEPGDAAIVVSAPQPHLPLRPV